MIAMRKSRDLSQDNSGHVAFLEPYADPEKEKVGVRKEMTNDNSSCLT